MSEKGLRVVITGASSGIGRAVAHEYARLGASLALFARREDVLRDVARECEDLGARQVLVLSGDTTNADDVRVAVDEIRTALMGVDRAFLNAGGYGDTESGSLADVRDVMWSAREFSAASAESVMQTNYGGTVKWLEAMLKVMQEGEGGTIAVTGAMAADRGYPRHGPYAASKAALRALVDATRSDAARHGIHMTLIEPGCVVSGLTEAECCAETPFIQPTDKAARRFVRGVERRERVIRFPWRASVLSYLLASLPRPVFDRWAVRRLPPIR